jgi:hypothetical protein
MSKTGKGKRGRAAAAGGLTRPDPRASAPPVRGAATTPGARATPGAPPPGFKPRPKLFVVLCLVFVLWVILLLVLYFTTVYPRQG